MIQLTDQMIRDAFSKLGLDEKFFPKYESEVKRWYSNLQNSDSDNEDTPYEMSIVASSLNFSAEYIELYVKELEKGHSEKWADTYARNMPVETDDNVIFIIEKEIANEDEFERELEIHADSLSKDIVFKKRYKSLLREGTDPAQEIAEEYTKVYYQCIDKGKSDAYAHAYAIATNDFSESYWEIYARSFEKAIEHGMSDFEAMAFGYRCVDAADQGFFTEMGLFAEMYKEDWQRDFYIQLIREDFEKYDKRILTDDEIEDIRKMF